MHLLKLSQNNNNLLVFTQNIIYIVSIPEFQVIKQLQTPTQIDYVHEFNDNFFLKAGQDNFVYDCVNNTIEQAQIPSNCYLAGCTKISSELVLTHLEQKIYLDEDSTFLFNFNITVVNNSRKSILFTQSEVLNFSFEIQFLGDTFFISENKKYDLQGNMIQQYDIIPTFISLDKEIYLDEGKLTFDKTQIETEEESSILHIQIVNQYLITVYDPCEIYVNDNLINAFLPTKKVIQEIIYKNISIYHTQNQLSLLQNAPFFQFEILQSTEGIQQIFKSNNAVLIKKQSGDLVYNGRKLSIRSSLQRRELMRKTLISLEGSQLLMNEGNEIFQCMIEDIDNSEFQINITQQYTINKQFYICRNNNFTQKICVIIHENKAYVGIISKLEEIENLSQFMILNHWIEGDQIMQISQNSFCLIPADSGQNNLRIFKICKNNVITISTEVFSQLQCKNCIFIQENVIMMQSDNEIFGVEIDEIDVKLHKQPFHATEIFRNIDGKAVIQLEHLLGFDLKIAVEFVQNSNIFTDHKNLVLSQSLDSTSNLKFNNNFFIYNVQQTWQLVQIGIFAIELRYFNTQIKSSDLEKLLQQRSLIKKIVKLENVSMAAFTVFQNSHIIQKYFKSLNDFSQCNFIVIFTAQDKILSISNSFLNVITSMDNEALNRQISEEVKMKTGVLDSNFISGIFDNGDVTIKLGQKVVNMCNLDEKLIVLLENFQVRVYDVKLNIFNGKIKPEIQFLFARSINIIQENSQILNFYSQNQFVYIVYLTNNLKIKIKTDLLSNLEVIEQQNQVDWDLIIFE